MPALELTKKKEQECVYGWLRSTKDRHGWGVATSPTCISDEALKIEILDALPEQHELFRPKLMESSVSDLGSCLITLENLFNPVDGGNQDGGFWL